MLEPIDQLENLTREAVPTVFDGMVSMHVVAETPAPLPEDASGHLLASVGFTGDTTGIVFLSLSMTFARVITSQILGISVAEIDHDEMVADALGELSNHADHSVGGAGPADEPGTFVGV
jgi:CheY-specific phosphatase CheX